MVKILDISKQGVDMFKELGGKSLGGQYINNYDILIDFFNQLRNTGFWRNHQMLCDETKDVQVVLRNCIVGGKERSIMLEKDFLSMSLTFHKEALKNIYTWRMVIRIRSSKSPNGYYENSLRIVPIINNRMFLAFNEEGRANFFQFAMNAYNALCQIESEQMGEFSSKNYFATEGEYDYDTQEGVLYNQDGSKINYQKDVFNARMEQSVEFQKIAQIMKERFEKNPSQHPTKQEKAFMARYLNINPYYQQEDLSIYEDMAQNSENWNDETPVPTKPKVEVLDIQQEVKEPIVTPKEEEEEVKTEIVEETVTVEIPVVEEEFVPEPASKMDGLWNKLETLLEDEDFIEPFEEFLGELDILSTKKEDIFTCDPDKLEEFLSDWV